MPDCEVDDFVLLGLEALLQHHVFLSVIGQRFDDIIVG